MLDSSEARIGNRVIGMEGSGLSQFPFPLYLLPSLTIILFADYRHPSLMSEYIHRLLRNNPWSHFRDAMLSHSQRTLSGGDHQRHWS